MFLHLVDVQIIHLCVSYSTAAFSSLSHIILLIYAVVHTFFSRKTIKMSDEF